MIAAHAVRALRRALAQLARDVRSRRSSLIAGRLCPDSLLESLYAYSFHDQWAGVWQIDNRPLLGAAFAIIALGSLSSPRWWQVLLDNPPLRFLATISYNLYLYHQLIARELLWRTTSRRTPAIRITSARGKSATRRTPSPSRSRKRRW